MRSVQGSGGPGPRRAAVARAAALAGLIVAGGCGHHGLAATRANMVGRYVFESADPGLRHGADTLTLRADGTYLLQRVQPAAVIAGRWRFENGREPEVLLDSLGYPVRVTGRTVRLLVDLDLGYAFVKQ